MIIGFFCTDLIKKEACLKTLNALIHTAEWEGLPLNLGVSLHCDNSQLFTLSLYGIKVINPKYYKNFNNKQIVLLLLLGKLGSIGSTEKFSNVTKLRYFAFSNYKL